MTPPPAPPAGPASGAPVRVCHVLGGATGGAWLVEQLRELRRRYGYEVHAVVGASEGSLVDRLRAEGIPFHVATFSTSLRHPLRAARAVVGLARHFRRQRYDIVQSHVFSTTLTARPAAWIADVPARLAMVSGPFHLEAARSRWLDVTTAWMESALVACCEKIRSIYRDAGIADARLSLVYYGVDTRTFDAESASGAGIRTEHGWPADTPVVALVSYFYVRLPVSWSTPEHLRGLGFKGQEDFVIAASLIRAELPAARFLLVGGPFDEGGRQYMEEVRDLVRALDLEDRVVFTGHRRDIHAILREVDVAVQASLTEGCGGTIEALLTAAPMVATRVGGMVDTVRDGETGVVVAPDDPHDLARGILSLLRDPARARALGRNGRQLMLDRFSLDRTVADLHALYGRVLADARRRRRGYSALVSLWRSACGLVLAAYWAARWRIAGWLEPRTAREPEPLAAMLRRSSLPADIVPVDSLVALRTAGDLPEDGLFLGGGWHGLERDHGQPYRWLESDGRIVITRPRRGLGQLVLLAESGPGQGYRPFTLRVVDERGVEVDRATIADRGEIVLRLPLRPGETGTFRLVAPAGVLFAADPRVLNLRVFRIAWHTA